MSLSSEIFIGTNLTEILRRLVHAKKTGLLTIQEAEREGALAVENGMIVSAATSSSSGIHALFQFVTWKQAHFEFHEHSLTPDVPRDLAVYDPELLIAGIAAKG